MPRAEDGLRERARRDPAGLVAGLEEVGQGLLAQPREVTLREVRPEGDVRHQRQRLAQPCDRHAQADGRGVPAGARREPGAEEVHGVGEDESVLPARPFIQQVRGHGGEALPARGVGGRPRAHDEGDLHHRHLAHRHEKDGEAVGQREALHGGQYERAHGAGLRWGAAVRLGEELSRSEGNGRCGKSDADGLAGVHRFTSGTARSFFPVGTTDTTTLPEPRSRAAACTSVGPSAR